MIQANDHGPGALNGNGHHHGPAPANRLEGYFGGGGDALPPQNIQAEQSVLGSILLDPDCFGAVRAILHPRDFYRPDHAALFDLFCRLTARGQPLDPVAIVEELARAGGLGPVAYGGFGPDGPDEYLADLLRAAPTAVNAVYYAEIVREKAHTRRLVEVMERGLRDAYAHRFDAGRLIARVRRRVEKLAQLADARPEDEAEAVLQRLADVEARPVDYLWPDRIPAGKVTLCAGEAKLGKSFFTLYLAAAVSAGLEYPGGQGQRMPRGSVVLLSAEDDLGDTVRPRLDAAGAAVDRVHALTTLRLPDGRRAPFDLSYLPALEAAIDRLGDVRLLILDPITQYLGAAVDDHKTVQLRAALGPLHEMAERLRVAVVCVTHVSKGSNPRAINRVIGSGAYTAFARFNWLFFRDPDDPKRRLMLDGGTNAVEEPTGLAYRIVAGRVVWEPEPVTITADDLVAKQREKFAAAGGGGSKADQAEAFLEGLFAPGVEIPSEVILKAGAAAGFSRHPMFEAKKKLNIRARQVGGSWVWLRDPQPSVRTARTEPNSDEPIDWKAF